MLPSPLSIERWLARAAGFPLDCVGLAQVISTLLQREGIVHEVHKGRLDVVKVGTIFDHWWVALSWQYPQAVIELRARTMLGNRAEVPHGVVLPTPQQIYQTERIMGLGDHSRYQQLAGEPLSVYPPL